MPTKLIIKKPNESGLSSYIIVAERLNLSNEVVKPGESMQKELDSLTNPEGQVDAYKKGHAQRELSLIQAKALAHLAFLGYTDQTYNNVFFTPKGQVAILDTEPMHRCWKKKEKQFFNIYKIQNIKDFILRLLFNNWLGGRLTYNETHEYGRKLSAINYLKSYCTLQVKQEVEKIEKNYYQGILHRSIGRCVTGIVASIAIPFLFASLPYSTFVIIPCLGVSVLKTISSVLQTVRLVGLNALSQMEEGRFKFVRLIEIDCI